LAEWIAVAAIEKKEEYKGTAQYQVPYHEG
jgi:hypothetical protein